MKESGRGNRAFHSRLWSTRFGWVLWLALAASIVVAVLITPHRHRTNNAYRTAALAYLHSEPMYTPGQQGFIYPVQSALVYIPFTFDPPVVSDILWRMASIAMLAAAIWRLSRVLDPRALPEERSPFTLLSLLVIPIAIGSARNGQMNLLLAGVLVHALVEVISRRWWPAAGWLVLALASKPIAIVPLLLFTAVYRPLWWRVPLGVLVIAAAPFLHPDWAYVLSQCRAGLAKVIEAGEPGAGSFSDLGSLLRVAGLEPGYAAMSAARAAAALFTLACCALATRRLNARGAAVFIAAMGTAYLMLFSPRTEGTTYVLLAPALAAIAAWSLRKRETRRLAVALVIACLLLGFVNLALPRGRDRWVRPAIAAASWIWLAGVALSPRWRGSFPAPQPDEDEAPRPIEIARGLVAELGPELAPRSAPARPRPNPRAGA